MLIYKFSTKMILISTKSHYPMMMIKYKTIAPSEWIMLDNFNKIKHNKFNFHKIINFKTCM